MSTRKVKDAKDLTSNELIYFKSHAKATYMSDGSTVEDAVKERDNVQSDWKNLDSTSDAYILNKPTKVSDFENDENFISEAPENGVAYIRKDKEWVSMEEVSKITSFKIVDSDGSNELVGSGDTSWIKGKRCLVKKTDTGVAICYLDDNNSELFHDGVTAASLDGSMGQWMTDLPEYYYSVDESTEGTHIMNLYQSNKPGRKQSRRVLLGVTEGVNVDGKLWSRKTGSEQSTGDLTSTVFHNYANAVGSGFDIIDYEAHCKIAHLFYAKYLNRNPQTIGTTSSLGNNDGKTSTQISFLGIEDFYGGKYEWMGGINGYNGTYYIYDGYQPDQVPTVPYRTVYCGFDSYTYGWIKNVKWGEYADMIPTEFGSDSSTYYCDSGAVAYSSWRVVCRSDFAADAYGGVTRFRGQFASSKVNAEFGSRLLFRGNIQVIEDPAEFIALPINM